MFNFIVGLFSRPKKSSKIHLFRRPAFPLVLVEAALEEVGEVGRQRLRHEDVVDDLALSQRQSDDAESIDVDLLAAPEKKIILLITPIY